MNQPVIIDFETKKSFRETSKHQELGISVACAYDYKTGKYILYEEHELTKLFKLLEEASIVVGYNIDGFDLPVLQAYYPGDVKQFKTFDLLSDIKSKLGRRLTLDNCAQSTLNKGKTGHGLQAIQLYKDGKLDELKQYCQGDVEITKELFEYGIKNGHIYYLDITEKKEIRVSWEKYMSYKDDSSSVSLTLPF
jgi:DEAD/DEAH box helicase domain-containing protein